MIDQFLKYWFWVWIDNSNLKWNEFWISKNFKEYLKFRKFSRYLELYDDTKHFTKQDKLSMYAMLHDYFVHLGYKGEVAGTNFDVKYLIWKYTL